MLQFYSDAALTLPVTNLTPKRFLVPLKGGTKQSTVYLADQYVATVALAASSGASTIQVDNTFEFFIAGRAFVNGIQISYTGKTGTTLTGVTGLTSAINPGDKIKPWKTYKLAGNLVVSPTGGDSGNGLNISVGPDFNSLSFPGTPAIFSNTIYDNQGAATAVAVQVSVIPGLQKEFTNWAVTTSNFYPREGNTATAIANGETGILPQLFGYVFRRDYQLPQSLRILPATRQVQAKMPGLVIGQHRWRDENDTNAQVIVPATWDPDVQSIGPEKFIAGIGHGDDLSEVDLEQSSDSVFLRINHGHYFTGTDGYYLPAGAQIDVFPANAAATFNLSATPRPTKPIFVGTYHADTLGYFDTETQYRYMSQGISTDPGAPKYQFTLDRATNHLTINTPLASRVIFLGTVSGNVTDYFDFPVFPVGEISRVFIDRGIGNPSVVVPAYVVDRTLGRLTVSSPTGAGVSIPGALKGEPVYAEVNQSIAVVYETGTDDSILLDSVDLNPAFSGLSGGYVYLQHRQQKPASLVLSTDKPRITVPATHDSIINLVAYGPVYFDGDYALLSVTALGPSGENIPNARLSVIVDSSFSGLLNYQNPQAGPVEVVTGGDGTANLVFIPKTGYGRWIPTIAAAGGNAGLATTTIANDSLVLPDGVPISQIRNSREGWLVSAYLVMNNDPLMGKVGANATLGEVTWVTTGTAGTVGYKTNGERNLWANGNVAIVPIDALDAAGHSYTNGLFSGTVVKLVYGVALPTTGTVGAYFITYVQRTTIKLQVKNSNVISNTILLQMAEPSVIVSNPWLILENSTQGRLNQFRLGWERNVPTLPQR
jgi:hypothetical protein